MQNLDPNDQVVTLLTGHQQALLQYIRTLLPRRADAEEVLQEVNLYLWRNRDDFEPGTNFSAWAYKTARFHVLSFRKRHDTVRRYAHHAARISFRRSSRRDYFEQKTDSSHLPACQHAPRLLKYYPLPPLALHGRFSAYLRF